MNGVAQPGQVLHELGSVVYGSDNPSWKQGGLSSIKKDGFGEQMDSPWILVALRQFLVEWPHSNAGFVTAIGIELPTG